MTSVLIIGDGPAGLAAAITLRKKSRKVVVAYRTKQQLEMRAGESLASSALTALRELGLAETFLADGHKPCYGNCSCWGNDQLAFFDFIQSVSGPGWYVDRVRFDRMLRLQAEAAGVEFIEAERVAALERRPDGVWTYMGKGGHVSSRLVIDASGRQRWLGRQLGIESVEDDQQVAVMRVIRASEPIRSAHSMVEAVKDGWWYVAEPGDGFMVVVFFTDPALHHRSDLSDRLYWQDRISETKFVRRRVNRSAHVSAEPPVIMAAGSSSLSRYAGPGWLAAGDAACALDPLSSHGIAFALRSGIDAGKAADVLLTQPADANEYATTLHQANTIYRQQRADIYRRETRWASFPYWLHRQRLQPV